MMICRKYILCFLILFVLNCQNSKVSGKDTPVLTVNHMLENSLNAVNNNRNHTLEEPISDVIQVVSENPTTAIEENSFRSNESSFDFCSSRPEFKFGSGSFLTYMLRLKLCHMAAGKPWFLEACKNKVYNITEYYSTVYIKFCHPIVFYSQCKKNISNSYQTVYQDDALIAVRHWMRKYHIAEVAGVINATIDSQQERQFHVYRSYCKTIDSFFKSLPESDIGIQGNTTADSINITNDFRIPFSEVKYTEWFLTYRPFCKPVACGVSLTDYLNTSLTAYDCFENSGKKAIVFVIVFDSILAVLIIVANVLVLLVAYRTPVMNNIPGYFKLSLAVADLIVGLIVLPGSICNHYVMSMKPLPYRSEGQPPFATDYFDQRYLDFMGVFTILSFSLSIYTMGAASVDRFLAITRPLQYHLGHYLTKQRATVVFVTLWLFGFICAIYPVFTTNHYTISSLSLVLSTGFSTIIVYTLTLGLPLVAVWCINGLMLHHVRAAGKFRRSKWGNPMQGSISSMTRRVSGTAQQGDDLSRLPSTDTVLSYDTTENGNDNKRNNTGINCNKSSPFTISQNIKNTRSNNNTDRPTLTIKQQLGRMSSTSLASQESIESRLAKTLAVMIGSFTIALLPSIIVLTVQPTLSRSISPGTYPKTYSASITNIYTSAEYVASRLFLSNSFWNCIIYSIRNRYFRLALVDAFNCDEKRRRRRSASRTTNLASSYRITGPRGGFLSKMSSTESGCIAMSLSDVKKNSFWDLCRPSSCTINEQPKDKDKRPTDT